MHACDVLILGDYFCDIIFTGLSAPPSLGTEIYGDALDLVPGGAFILAAGFHRLGVAVRWRARLGSDLFSRFIREEAEREGLDTSLFQYFDRPLRNVSASFSFVEDRGFISYSDTFPEAPVAELIAAQRPRWVLNVPFNGSSENLKLIELIHQHGGRVFTDCQYVTTTLDEPGLTDMLRAIDIFAPNQSEACQLTGEDDPQKAALLLAKYCPLVIIKCSHNGAIACTGSQTWHSPALPVQVVDTTGAGDAFNVGFLTAHLRGEPLETCLRYGNICGGLSTTRPGGASAAPTLEQLQQYL